MWTLLRSYATVRPTKGAYLRQWMVAEPVDTSKARVLIVEEEAVAQLAARALTKAGCECETSGSGESALHALEQRGAYIVLEVLDLLRHRPRRHRQLVRRPAEIQVARRRFEGAQGVERGQPTTRLHRFADTLARSPWVAKWGFLAQLAIIPGLG